MGKSNQLGSEGEALARRHLDQEGYLILENNWHFHHLEVDIIAFKDDHVVFVEVKTRTTDDFGEPESFVDWKKRRAYVRAANAYMLEHNRNEEARFDIISIVINQNGTTLSHLENAFTTAVL